LVGIAGEDDLDAPDLNGRPQPGGGDSGRSVDVAVAEKLRRPAGNGKDPGRPILDADASAALRDRLIREITRLDSVGGCPMGPPGARGEEHPERI